MAIAAASALSACSTTIREIREHPPRSTYVSNRTGPELEACLAGNLSWIAQPSIIHGETSTELAFGGSGGGATALLVTLHPLAKGTQVEVRELLMYGARVRHNVEACVAGRDK